MRPTDDDVNSFMSQFLPEKKIPLTSEENKELKLRNAELEKLVDTLGEALKPMVMEADARRCGLKIADEALVLYEEFKKKDK